MTRAERSRVNRVSGRQGNLARFGGGGFWRSGRVTALRCLWSIDLPIGEIAVLLGCSKNSVIGKAHRLKLPARAIDRARQIESQVAGAKHLADWARRRSRGGEAEGRA